MKVILHNGTELEAMSVFGSHEVVQGEGRDCLSFVFPASDGLEAINAVFSEKNCESIRLAEANGNEHVHTGYVIRAALTLTPGEEGGEGQITVTMAKRTEVEEKIEKMAAGIISNTRISGQLSAAAKFYVQTATDVPDETAIEMLDLFKTWEEVLAAAETVAENSIINDGGTLYRVVASGGVLPQANQPPHGEGMLAVYRPIDTTHAGTMEDPIQWVYGMDCTSGLYYSYNATVYLCKADMKPCVWAPGTAGLWQWDAVDAGETEA